jgi:hypothetical protein
LLASQPRVDVPRRIYYWSIRFSESPKPDDGWADKIQKLTLHTGRVDDSSLRRFHTTHKTHTVIRFTFRRTPRRGGAIFKHPSRRTAGDGDRLESARECILFSVRFISKKQNAVASRSTRNENTGGTSPRRWFHETPTYTRTRISPRARSRVVMTLTRSSRRLTHPQSRIASFLFSNFPLFIFLHRFRSSDLSQLVAHCACRASRASGESCHF